MLSTVTGWRGTGRTDAELVRLLAFGGLAAVERAEQAITSVSRWKGGARP